MNPEVVQWIGQLGDTDQVVSFHAYQCLQEAVLHASGPGREPEQQALAAAMGEALVARAATAKSGGAPVEANPFLSAAASRMVAYAHPPRARVQLARLLGYVPREAAVRYLAEALEDADAREMARCSLEGFASGAATDALVKALESAAGAAFRVGVVNSLAKRRGETVAAALRRAAEDAQPEVKEAALYALADLPDRGHDAILAREKSSVARVRLAGTLRRNGDEAGAKAIYRAVIESDAPEAQKRAARIALG